MGNRYLEWKEFTFSSFDIVREQGFDWGTAGRAEGGNASTIPRKGNFKYFQLILERRLCEELLVFMKF